jgi:hypothetical protein
MRSCRFGLSLLVFVFFGNLSALGAQSATSPAVPPAARAAQRASFERLGDLLDRDEVAEGALELAALAAPVNAPAPTPAEKAILQRAVAIGRRHLKRTERASRSGTPRGIWSASPAPTLRRSFSIRRARMASPWRR